MIYAQQYLTPTSNFVTKYDWLISYKRFHPLVFLLNGFLEIEVIVQTVVFCHKAWLASCQGTHQRVTVHHIWSPFQFRFFLKLRRFWVKYENFCFCKSSSNPFLEPTSTKQWEQSFLLKETTWTFDGAQTHDWRISSQIRYPLRQVPSLFGRLLCIL